MDIETYVFKMGTPFLTVNYLVGNFSENVDVLKSKCY